MQMAKKHFKCPECGYEFDAEVSFLQDKDKTTLTGLGIGAAVGFMLGGPVGAVAGATFGGKWGKRTPKLMDDIRCPKCNHGF